MNGAGTDRSGAGDDWERLRRAISNEEEANQRTIDMLAALNDLNERSRQAKVRLDQAYSEWDHRWSGWANDFQNIKAAQKRWNDVVPTLTGEDGIKDWDAWNREKGDWLRAGDLASQYSGDEFWALRDKINSAEGELATAKDLEAAAGQRFASAQELWQRAADELASRGAEYQSKYSGDKPGDSDSQPDAPAGADEPQDSTDDPSSQPAVPDAADEPQDSRDGPHVDGKCWCGKEHKAGICPGCGRPLDDGTWHYHGH